GWALGSRVRVRKALRKGYRPLNGMWAWVNSQACPASKRTPRTIVATSRMKKLRRLSCATASSAKWQVTPLESRIIVLKKGIGHQLTGTVFGGGQLNGCEPKR